MFQICRFCWHRIRTDENGLCPACRKVSDIQQTPDKEEFLVSNFPLIYIQGCCNFW